MKFMHVLQEDLPGEWDHNMLQKGPRAPSTAWQLRSVLEKLWDDLDRTSSDFQQAYFLFLGVVKD
jgi:hypothetical protein